MVELFTYAELFKEDVMEEEAEIFILQLFLLQAETGIKP